MRIAVGVVHDSRLGEFCISYSNPFRGQREGGLRRMHAEGFREEEPVTAEENFSANLREATGFGVTLS